MPSNRSGPQSDSTTPPAELLQLRTSPPRERSDAARNRAAVLTAAAALFREHGVAGVSMDAVAAAAGVGKGTLFRRFGDKAGLATALLDTQERALQEAILFGPAPLGPGPAGSPAPPSDRLAAFVGAYLDHLLDHLDLVRVSETASPGARYRIGAYRFWHRHVTLLLAGGPDPAADAHALLAALSAEHVRAVLDDVGADRLRAATLRLATALAGGDQAPA
ncbi:TetR family transcriptional regulator [Micromonospora auratinigra]|uniref:Transcriptional regulator, TetR family n=1 Tax=Micromonospora auratinigra TaxID=261654 RepID=A0A1A8Z7R4_9ACTN|nr:TetR family transcriptional regulator [Micromonospora auratinigra]SBT39891.1 transcriptional regulator, TetR family [Micromonospora auratinigra]